MMKRYRFFSCFPGSYCWALMFFLLCVSLPRTFRCADFSYAGPDCSIVYRFIPSTGTLNDLTVIYNGSFVFHPSSFGGIVRFHLGGADMSPWEGRHTSQLLGESWSGGVYTARFRWRAALDSFEFTLRAWISGKSLMMQFTSDSRNVMELGFDRSEETPDPKVVELPYGHNVLYTSGVFVSGIVDPFLSNGSDFAFLNSRFSDTSAYFGQTVLYQPLTGGTRNPLNETISITVSPEISDTLFRPPNPVSPYRSFLSNKIVVDLWRPSFADYAGDLQTLASMGMTDLFAIVHTWQRYGYDSGLPTTFPAGEAYGGEAGMRDLSDVCSANGILLSLHTNYIDFYENSDVWNPADLALDPDGTWVEGWFNPGTGMQSYMLKPSRAVAYARIYEPAIHDAYGTTAAYLDVHTAVHPSHRIDYDSSVPGAGKEISTFGHYGDLLAYVRDVHGGPVAGEGMGCSTNIWAGYVDATEADPRSHLDTINNRGGTQVPVIADYKLEVLHDLFVPHGAGYIERFYYDKWFDFTADEVERYRATEIAYGNAGFIHNDFEKRIPIIETQRDYCFLKHLQRYYLTESPSEILYRVDGGMLTLSEALRSILPGVAYESVESTLNERLSMIKVTYSGGFTLCVNRSTADTWDVVEGGVTYTLPPSGFLAVKGSEFLAYTAVVGGTKTYYLCPGEALCSTCPAACGPGDPCDDGDACTGGDRCNAAGSCAGVPYACAPGPCEDLSDCDGLGGCLTTPSPADMACSLGDPCSVGDHCDGAGHCVSGGIDPACPGDGPVETVPDGAPDTATQDDAASDGATDPDTGDHGEAACSCSVAM